MQHAQITPYQRTSTNIPGRSMSIWPYSGLTSAKIFLPPNVYFFFKSSGLFYLSCLSIDCMIQDCRNDIINTHKTQKQKPTGCFLRNFEIIYQFRFLFHFYSFTWADEIDDLVYQGVGEDMGRPLLKNCVWLLLVLRKKF